MREYTGAPTIAFGPHVIDPTWVEDDTPDAPDPADAAAADAVGEPVVEEALDLAFDPDVRVADGEVAAAGAGWTLRAVHTPGHTSNHLCFSFDEQQALFSGDHIMGWSTTVITPPDGNMRDYFSSLQRVKALAPTTLWPTHGSPVTEVPRFIDEFVQHRLDREAAVLAAVRAGTTMIPDVVRALYVGVNEQLYKAAGRSVLAHMIKLIDDGLVTFVGDQPGVTTPYRPV